MNRVFTMKDRRLIEALDYIDDEYIASAALYKMRSYAESTRPLAQTAGESLKKHWKHYLGFVACLLVLALAAPLFGYLPEIINSFAAGWGEGSETLKGDETTNGMYDEYILTEDDLAQINEAHFLDGIADLIEQGCDLSDEEIEQRRNSKYSKYALTVDEAMQRSKEDRFYFGKFGDCFIFKIGPGERPSFNPMTYILGEYKITIQGFIRVVYNYEWIHLSEAYERGLLSDKDVAKLYEVYCKYYGDNKTE